MPRSRLPGSFTSGARWTGEEASIALSALEDSGLSVNAFAEREGLDPQRLYFWKRRLGGAKARPSAKFVELTPRSTGAVEVVLRNGRVLRVPVSIDASALRALVAVLEDGAC